MFKSPSDVAFSLFNYDIKFYGIMLFLGMTAGLFASYAVAKKYYKNVELGLLLDFYPWLIIISVLCARLYYVLLSLEFYMRYPAEIPAVWHGGISIHGAILGGLLTGVIYFKFIKKKPILPYADVVSCGLALGQGIGRWGNFFNQEAFGRPCDLPWKLYIDPAFRPVEYSNFEFFHPAFLYESIWDFTVFFALCAVLKFYPKRPAGTLFFTYLLFYSAGRMITEHIRIDSVLDICGVPIALIVSLLTFLIAIFALVILFKKPS